MEITILRNMYFLGYFDAQHVLHMFNGSKIDYVEQCVHLGNTLYADISIRNINNAVNDLFMRTNNLMADFSNAHSSYGVLTIINL